MRKLFALTMVAALSLTIALAIVGCGKKTEPAATEMTPPVETSTMSDSGAMMSDSGMSSMGQDTTAHQ